MNTTQHNIQEFRINSLKRFLKSSDEAILITSNVNRKYFSFLNSSEGAILITKENQYLLVDFRYFEIAKMLANDYFTVKLANKLFEELTSILSKLDISQLYIEEKGINLKKFHKLQKSLSYANITIDSSFALDQIIENTRLIKSDDELKKIKIAQEITEEAFNEVLAEIVPGVTERSIAFKTEFLMREKGAAGVAFDLICLTGTKTSMPHGQPDDTMVHSGDLFQFDIGATYDGYCSDMSRVVAVGSVSDYQREIYDIVLAAQMAALNVAKSGVTASTVDKVARDVITDAGYGKYFGHSTGHGVGLEIHESPAVASTSHTLLSKNMVITVEPGIYLPNKFGIRIEDMIVITNTKNENITNTSKQLVVL